MTPEAQEEFYKTLAQAAREYLYEQVPESEKISFYQTLEQDLGPEVFKQIAKLIQKNRQDEEIAARLVREGHCELLKFFHTQKLISADKTLSYLLRNLPEKKDMVDSYIMEEKYRLLNVNLSPFALQNIATNRDIDLETKERWLNALLPACNWSELALASDNKKEDLRRGEEFKYQEKEGELFFKTLDKLICLTPDNSLPPEVVEILGHMQERWEPKTQYALLDKAQTYPPRFHFSLSLIFEYTALSSLDNKLESIQSKYENFSIFLLWFVRSASVKEGFEAATTQANEWIKKKIKEKPLSLSFNVIGDLIEYSLSAQKDKKNLAEYVLAHAQIDTEDFLNKIVLQKNSFRSYEKEIEKSLLQFYLNYMEKNKVNLPAYTQFLLKRHYPEQKELIQVFFEKKLLQQTIAPQLESISIPFKAPVFKIKI